jgi:hypothetical protein
MSQRRAIAAALHRDGATRHGSVTRLVIEACASTHVGYISPG